jgi:hypothetical protein
MYSQSLMRTPMLNWTYAIDALVGLEDMRSPGGGDCGMHLYIAPAYTLTSLLPESVTPSTVADTGYGRSFPHALR